MPSLASDGTPNVRMVAVSGFWPARAGGAKLGHQVGEGELLLLDLDTVFLGELGQEDVHRLAVAAV